MATRYYFHNATSGLSNLPTTKQTSLTIDKNLDAQTVNRTMDTTIGTAQASLALTSNATTSKQTYYFTRFVSPALSGVTAIDANTWTYNFATKESNTSANFPVTTSGATGHVTLYVWRPGTGKLGNIFDASSITMAESQTAAELNQSVTFSGSAVASVSNGDVICFELIAETTQAAATAYTDTFYFDGATITLTSAQIVSNHATFLETPQDLTGGGGGPVTCTVTGKSIYNKTTTHA